MKKLSLLFFLCFLTLTGIRAQSLTDKDIAGEWEMSAFNMSGIYFDFGKDSLALSDALKAQLEPGKEAAVVADIKQRLTPYKEGHVRIGPGSQYSQTLMGETADGVYKLTQKDGRQYLSIVNNNKNKDVDELRVWKDKGWLYISMPAEDGSDTILMFERK